MAGWKKKKLRPHQKRRLQQDPDEGSSETTPQVSPPDLGDGAHPQREKKLRPHQKRRFQKIVEVDSPEDAADGDKTNLLDSREHTSSDVLVRLATSSRHSIQCTPLASLEAARLLAVRQLGELFRERCTALGAKKHYAHFEAWLWTARAQGVGEKLNVASNEVPVLPQCRASDAQRELRQKLLDCGVPVAEAKEACDALDVCCDTLLAGLRVTEARAVVAPVHARQTEVGMMRLSCKKVHVDVSEVHLQKLRAMHTAQHPVRENLFMEGAFCVLARLMSLQGGHVNAGGMQAACPSRVYDSLRADFGATMELFASPLNARFPRFCSAAADVDTAFGADP